ncbi:unnamed protein product [Rotaria sordida]|uniref:Uncharacterized protein n=1 Tax=Rotaria sordida TaxID=392033 RepID=A0A813VGZ3_9BILA|nr:unnamed protein product [Rotaria sordida]CAF0988880.1 unnamed protein product [Rotaria sordida]CAF1062743.1 unnamed protein product [Rotaria sordida]CAF3701726.1 unnamed protein product [Rotaria sordida]
MKYSQEILHSHSAFVYSNFNNCDSSNDNSSVKIISIINECENILLRTSAYLQLECEEEDNDNDFTFEYPDSSPYHYRL